MRNLIIALLMALSLSATAQGIIRHDTPKPQRQQTTKKSAAKQAAKPVPKAADPIKKLYSDMVYVEGGTFTMGAKADENYWDVEHAWPAHQVTVSGFYLCRYETTQALWQKVMGKNPSEYRGANHPVESVSWNDIQKFIRKLNALTGKHYRLPTEAEWEWAARGGNRSRGYRYSGSNNIDEVAWYKRNTHDRHMPVGTKRPNELGLYDMSGIADECLLVVGIVGAESALAAMTAEEEDHNIVLARLAEYLFQRGEHPVVGGVAAGERGDMARVGLVELCHRGGIVLGLAEGLDMLVFGYAYRHHVDVAGVGGGADGKGHHEEQQVYLLHRLEDGG